MNDFKTTVSFEMLEDDQLTGSIRMYNQDMVIQDDEINQIIIKGNHCEFYIPAKETSYKGTINSNKNEITGNFIFPDGSKHTLNLSKQEGVIVKPIDKYIEIKEKTYSIPQLKEDLSFLYSSLIEHHPKLFAYTSENDMKILFEKISDQIVNEMTIEEFFNLTTQLSDAVKCSHTGVRMPQEYQRLINDFGNHFPFELFFNDGKAYCLEIQGNHNPMLVPGSEIISINDRPISKIISHLFFFNPSEGINHSSEYYEINQNFNLLFYFLDDSEEFKIEYKLKDVIHRTKISACRLSELKLSSHKHKTEEAVSFRHIENQALSILKIPSFGIRNMEAYLQKLNTIFTELKKEEVNNLIVDLRDNRGGHPIFAAQLLSFLIDHDFTYFKRNGDIPDFEPLYNPMKADSLNYSGNIFVLVNSGCLSTTGHLISLLDYHSNASFIGESPGSTYECNDYSTQLQLPNTGIELNVPRTTFITSVADENVHFSIDHEIQNNIMEVLSNKDVYIEKVIFLVDSQ